MRQAALSLLGIKKDSGNHRRPSQPEITDDIISHNLTSSNRLPKATKLWQLAPDDVSLTPERPIKNPSDVAFLAPFTFAVADSVGHRIVVYDISSNICSVIREGDIWPNSVAVTRDNKIVATDRKKKVIKTYDVRGDLLSTWDPGEDVLIQPHGIAVTSRGETIVTDPATNRVYVFSGDGQVARHFGSKGDLLQQLRLPFYVTVDRSDVILVSDNMNYCVKSFDVNGNYLRKIGSGNTFGQRQFQCPYGVCIDPGSQELLVADSLSNRVFSFASDGKFQRYLLTSNADNCLNPCGIAVGPCGTLVVTEANPDYGNVKAFALYESVDGNHNIEGLWGSRTELYLLTWNVGEANPPKDLTRLLGLDGKTLPNLYAVGLQEMRSTTADLVFEDNWTSAITDCLSTRNYVRIKTRRQNGIHISVYGRKVDLPYITNVESECTKAGLGGLWGNKGALSVRLNVFGVNLCIVAAHYAAHSENFRQRIEDYNLTLETQKFRDKDCETILDHDYVFWMGDLNFRIDGISNDEVRKRVKENDLEHLAKYDQLKKAIKEELIFIDFHEGPLTFAPTFKFDVGTDFYDTSVKNRVPSWCDRILWRVHEDSYEGVDLSVEQLSYVSIADEKTSDHRPVLAEFTIQVLKSPSELPVMFEPIGCWCQKKDNDVSYLVSSNLTLHSRDWIGLYRDGYKNWLDYVTYVWASGKGDDMFDGSHMHSVLFEMRYLQSLPSDTYYLLYFSFAKNCVVGYSDAFRILSTEESSSSETDEGEGIQLRMDTPRGSSANNARPRRTKKSVNRYALQRHDVAAERNRKKVEQVKGRKEVVLEEEEIWLEARPEERRAVPRVRGEPLLPKEALLREEPLVCENFLLPAEELLLPDEALLREEPLLSGAEPFVGEKPLLPETPLPREESLLGSERPLLPEKPLVIEEPLLSSEKPLLREKPLLPDEPLLGEEPLPSKKPLLPEKPLPKEEPLLVSVKPLLKEEPLLPEEALVTEKPLLPREPLPSEKPLLPKEPLLSEKPSLPDKPMLPTDVPLLSSEKPLLKEEPLLPKEPLLSEKPSLPDKPMLPTDVPLLSSEKSLQAEELLVPEEPLLREEPLSRAVPLRRSEKPLLPEEPLLSESHLPKEELLLPEEPLLIEEPLLGEKALMRAEPLLPKEPLLNEKPFLQEESLLPKEPLPGEEQDPLLSDAPLFREVPLLRPDPLLGESPLLTEELLLGVAMGEDLLSSEQEQMLLSEPIQPLLGCHGDEAVLSKNELSLIELEQQLLEEHPLPEHCCEQPSLSKHQQQTLASTELRSELGAQADHNEQVRATFGEQLSQTVLGEHVDDRHDLLQSEHNERVNKTEQREQVNMAFDGGDEN